MVHDRTKSGGKTGEMHGNAGMTIMVVADTGCEEACEQEILRWLPASGPAIAHSNLVELRGTAQDAALLSYHLQTARRVAIRCAPALRSLDDVESAPIDHTIIDALVPKDATFKAEGDVLGLRADGAPAMDPATPQRPAALPMTQDLVETVGGWAHTALKRQVDLKRPGIVIYAMATADGIDIGVDAAGIPLSRREYRIMLSSRSLKATVAAAAIIYALADEEAAKTKKTASSKTSNPWKGITLDPFVDDGTLCIEAALLRTRTSPRKFVPMSAFAFTRFPALEGTDWAAWKKERDSAATKASDGVRDIVAYASSMREMKAVRTNSKLAGVDDAILSTKVDIDWIDLKREESSVGRIITSPVTSGKSLAPRSAAKLQEMLFNQSEYILKRDGAITCVTDKRGEITAAADKHGFVLAAEHAVLMGKRPIMILAFRNAKHKT